MTSSLAIETSSASSFRVNIGTPAASSIVVTTEITTSVGTDAAGNPTSTSTFVVTTAVTTAVTTLPPADTSIGSPPPDHSHNTSMLPALLGAVLATVTFVLLMLGIFLWRRRIKKRRLPLTAVDGPGDAQFRSDWNVTPFNIDPQPNLADRHQEPTPIYTQTPGANERDVEAQDRKDPIVLAANPTGTVYAQDSGWRPEGVRAALVDVEVQPPRYEDAQ